MDLIILIMAADKLQKLTHKIKGRPQVKATRGLGPQQHKLTKKPHLATVKVQQNHSLTGLQQ